MAEENPLRCPSVFFYLLFSLTSSLKKITFKLQAQLVQLVPCGECMESDIANRKRSIGPPGSRKLLEELGSSLVALRRLVGELSEGLDFCDAIGVGTHGNEVELFTRNFFLVKR